MVSVLILGSGGVGSMAAYALDSHDDTTVTTVIRSDYDAVKENGYKIKSVDYGDVKYHPTNIVKTLEDARQYGPFDYVVVSTKNTPDITKVENLIEPVVTEEVSAIVLLQNGIDIGAPVIAKYPKNVVLSGVSMISSTNYGDGVIDHEGHDFLKVGYFENTKLPLEFQEKRAKDFVDLYHNGKNECLYDEDVKYTRWRKLVYNATLNPICTLTNVDVGRLEMFGGVELMVRPAMREVLAIAKSDGVTLDESIMEFMIRSDDGVYYSPSMLVDLRKGNYVELEVINGNPVRIAQKNGVDAPVLTMIYNLLKVIQLRTKEAKGAIEVPKDRPLPGDSFVLQGS
ncbi:CIC11C00000001593 [Sungouiella intermedia]|uniref:2-dehydropantoate 2-reductase n=1 Tax=Sungouiella intermedia TaxID=45354 RepID=A0A1L0DCD1_9ASCO|nr:CIC11C00000001593 [[Candida] intermedia]